MSPLDALFKLKAQMSVSAELEAAAIELMRARDGTGNLVSLGNPMDPQELAKNIAHLTDRHLTGDTICLIGNRVPNPGELHRAALAAVDNVLLLAGALREHIRAGNYP